MTQNSAKGLCRFKLGSGTAKLVMEGRLWRPAPAGGAFHSLIPPGAT
jgi:hypothetical protein